ncbi:MAG: hypothetical protein JNJ57_05290 [Saprospiraceae bacterium]|nr:hypothetical protein [Saprospiraceae bacterium]
MNNFDKKIKSSLENLDVPFDATSWSALEHKLNKPFSEEEPSAVEPVDLVSKRVLDRIDIPYQHNHWNILARQLDRLATIRRIRNYKIAEAAIFILLLANVQFFFGGIGEVIKQTSPETPEILKPMADNGNGKKSKRGLSVEQNATAATITDASFFDPSSSDPTNISISSPSFIDQHSIYTQAGLVHFDAVELLPNGIRSMANADQTPTSPYQLPIKPTKTSAQWYASAFGGYDMHQIQNGQFQTSNSGYGYGMTVGYRKGKWGVESGIVYQQVSYTPEKINEFYAGNPVDGFLASHNTEVAGDLVSIPVRVTRQLANLSKTTVHASAGVSGSFAAGKRFSKKSVFYPGTSQSSGNGPDPDLNPIPNKKNDGLLEGGGFAGNSLLTAEMGIRIERPISRRYTAFVAPSYRRNLNRGFGPQGEKVHSFMLQAGVMATL